MIAPSVLIVIDRPDSTLRTLEIGATGRPDPIRGLTLPVATRCTPSSSASESSRRREPLVDECLWWVFLAIASEHELGQAVRDELRPRLLRLLRLFPGRAAGEHERRVESRL